MSLAGLSNHLVRLYLCIVLCASSFVSFNISFNDRFLQSVCFLIYFSIYFLNCNCLFLVVFSNCFCGPVLVEPLLVVICNYQEMFCILLRNHNYVAANTSSVLTYCPGVTATSVYTIVSAVRQ